MSSYNRDVHTPKVLSFLGEHLGNLAVSNWTRVGMASALGIQVRRGDTSSALAQHILTTSQQHLRAKEYTQLFTTAAHFDEAERLLKTFDRKLRSGDALHLAIAKLEHLDLITLDREIY